MLTPDPIDPNRFHTGDDSVTLGFSAVNSNNQPSLIVNNAQQMLAPEVVSSLNLMSATFPLTPGNNVLSITLVFTGGAGGAPEGRYEIHEVVTHFGQKFAFFLKSRQQSEAHSFFLIFERP